MASATRIQHRQRRSQLFMQTAAFAAAGFYPAVLSPPKDETSAVRVGCVFAFVFFSFFSGDLSLHAGTQANVPSAL